MRDSDFSVILQGQQVVISGVRERITRQDCAYTSSKSLMASSAPK